MAVAKKKKKQSKKQNKVRKQRTKKKRRRLRYGRIFLAIFIVGLLGYLFFHFVKFNIKTITIHGNQILSDQEVITIASLESYPSTFTKPILAIKNNLEKSDFIKKAKVRKKGLFQVDITIEENKPLFYNKTAKKTVLSDGTESEKMFDVPILINYVPDKIYQQLLEKMNLIQSDIVKRISEIEYKPNDVDQNRFLLSMQDGNYVYVTIYKFEHLNSYVDIIRKFENQKGILYLDSGEYFKVYEK